jgi:hypothetical protein
MIEDRELLRPSLTADARAPEAIYSAGTGFLTSFLGGPVAGAMIALLNSHRLRRLGRDWPIALLALGISVLVRLSVVDHFWDWLDGLLGKGSIRYVADLIGMVFFGLIYALHKPFYRSMSLLGLKAPPNGLGVGLAAIGLGIAVQFALFRLIPA